MEKSGHEIDQQTRATITIAWIIFANKPFYPLYVWYLSGHTMAALVCSLIAAPFFLAVPFIARRSALTARIALPLLGTVDTFFETKVFGAASGTEFFFAACIMLTALSFRTVEKNWQRALAAFVFLMFVLSRSGVGTQRYGWSGIDLSVLLNLNAFGAASLTAFIALRYAGVVRDGQ